MSSNNEAELPSSESIGQLDTKVITSQIPPEDSIAKSDSNELKKDKNVASLEENQSKSLENKSLTEIQLSKDSQGRQLINLFPKKPSVDQSGSQLLLASNYFNFAFKDSANKAFFKYAVDFIPDIPGDSTNLRRRLIGRIKKDLIEVYGNFIFNNTVLFCAENHPETVSLESKNDEQVYTIQIKWVSFIEASSTDAMPLYRKFFFGLLGQMSFIQFKRSYFDKNELQKVNEVEVWPGFNPSINIFDKRVLLNLNTISKIIRTENALDFLLKLQKSIQNQKEFQEKAKEELSNTSVLTRYNNDKTFQISSINFSLNPTCTFETSKGPISYVDYYKTKYNKTIVDLAQPLLVSIDKKSKKEIHLIPEMCYLTGLTEEMRSNFNFMKSITSITIGQAHKKMMDCIKLVQSIINNPKCVEQSNKWGIEIKDEPVLLTGRKLNPGDMRMRNINIPIEETMDLERKVQTEMFTSPKIERWIIFYCKSLAEIIEKTFIPQLQAALGTFRFAMLKPLTVAVNSSRWPDWEQTLRSMKPGAQFVLAVLPGQRGKGFFYSEVKSFFTNLVGIASQVVLEGTVRKERGLRSVINKVLIQICAKMDGEPWVISSLPYTQTPTAIMAFFMYKGILSSCSTYNQNYSKYTTKALPVTEPGRMNEYVNELFTYHILQFKMINGIYPHNVIVLRDGITPSERNVPLSEIKAIKELLLQLKQKEEKEVKLSYILINKKHNLKVVLKEGVDKYANIPSGTMIDNVVVDDNYEFYLVSQRSTQGISQATQYKIIYDDIKLTPADIHLFVYKLCFLYYNWTGGIKTPAPSHYAKKLAFLIGDKLCDKGKMELPNDNIKSLYFL